ncbi:transposable element Tc3 transposase [Trichonephila clavipes]|nr:transposable element Tc3 transposase [Trichonephila clavipes]
MAHIDTPTAYATVLCVQPHSSLSLIHQAMDSGRSCFSDIFQSSLFSKQQPKGWIFSRRQQKQQLQRNHDFGIYFFYLFQQDGATCHTARATIDLLKDTFGDRLISRFGPVNWPPTSCDLTPVEYFLWGYVKSLVYVDKPQTLDQLEDNIRRVIADIRPQMLEKVIEYWTSRLDCIRASHGSHMPEIIFKM